MQRSISSFFKKETKTASVLGYPTDIPGFNKDSLKTLNQNISNVESEIITHKKRGSYSIVDEATGLKVARYATVNGNTKASVRFGVPETSV